MERKLPNRITFQWHITDRCNLRCMHCYQENYTSEGLPLKDLLSILSKLTDFVGNCLLEHTKVKAHINFTGGEPFLRKDLLHLLSKTKETGLFSFGILSNGLLPSNNDLKELRKLKPRFVQISLEGKKETNDKIRGDGSYNKILHALDVYNKAGIPTMLSFTANSENYSDYPHIVKVARKYNAFKVWTDRYLPCNNNDKLMLTSKQFSVLCDLIYREQKLNKYRLFSKTRVSSERALQFLTSGGRPYRCVAGENLMAILPNGDLLPCRRLPIKVGNILSDNIVDLYQNNALLSNINNLNKLDKSCSECYYKTSCNGGLKCLSYATSASFYIKDINCPI